MKRLKLFLMILLLLNVMIAVVVFRSPYAPVVGGPVDIEVLWAIEDTRTESEKPLVTALENHGVPLAYDADNNTFYCTLGTENMDEWPELHLTVTGGGGGTHVLFSDDYTYDWCNDAIAEGYAYELMAYNDTEYSYFYLVFTALPQLCIWTEGREITTEEIPVELSMSCYGEAPLSSTARIHLRGASTLLQAKKGYKVEFTRQRYGGESKVDLEAPGFGLTDELALLPCAGDETRMRDKLGWDLYSEMAGVQESFGARRAEYIEVFIDDAYMGLYLLVEPVDVEKELALSGDHCLITDSVYRTATLSLAKGRAALPNPLCENAGYELYYSPQGNDTFAGMDTFLELIQEEDDVIFCEKALECVDMKTMLRHLMLIQAGGMTDNVFNNMFIWAHKENGKTIYRFSCWDMDWSWGLKRDEIGESYENWLYFPVADRMLNLDAGGIRRQLLEEWQLLRKTVLDEQALEERISQYQQTLDGSGALMREEERWGFQAADGYEIVSFASQRWALLDEAIAGIAEHTGSIGFLASSCYDKGKGSPIEWD